MKVSFLSGSESRFIAAILRETNETMSETKPIRSPTILINNGTATDVSRCSPRLVTTAYQPDGESIQLFAEAIVRIKHTIDGLMNTCIENKKALRRFSTLAVAAAVSVATGPAGATTLYMLDGPTHMTSVSGSTSSLSKVLGGTKDYKAIHRISNWESGNHPCKVKIKMRHLNKYTATSETETLDNGCDNDKISVGYSDTETYISGIQVCINNHKIKGLRVWGSELNRHTGGLSSAARKEDKRSNCNNNWKAKYVCPAGEIATQVIMPYGLKDFVGAALVCREIVAQ